ncbi:MAG: 16S rRNA (cytosine(1402)-N(4))-methyltransferase RsmH [Gemmataceae bacterium]
MTKEPGSTNDGHISVLPREVMDLLSPQPGEIWVDATTGLGGHASSILEAIGRDGRLICLDQDPEMLTRAKVRLGTDRVVYYQTCFDQLRAVLDKLGLETVDGVLADLGVCSVQLDTPSRGMSFLREGPLDMRFDTNVGEPASRLLERLNERELAELFWEFGEERFRGRIARRIVETRQEEPIRTTTQLAALIRRSVPKGNKRPGGIDPATRVFQALRIAVNDELGSLERLLKSLPSCIRSGGKAGVISFHSLEDRLVKWAFREQEVWDAVTRKPVQPSEAEARDNPRARSAKLRVAIRK